MSQQRPFSSNNEEHKRRLFYDNGIRYLEVRGKLTGDYTPPKPVLKSQVNETIQSSSGLVQRGTGHYSCSVQVLFHTKGDYADWLQFIGSKHKFYDEKGTVYVGIVNGEIGVNSVEQERKYLVTIPLVLIRKQDFEFRHEHSFLDVEGHWAEDSINEMQQRGLISVYDHQGNPVRHFQPNEGGTRSHAVSFITRTYSYLNKMLRGY